ncbi:ExbD/TolR family protein [Celeribacter sp.]|uniref:ExbD/TolR family protein n=1 Tax=Celeribacter sp. TaxID=1890673 RepID=UPI003A948B26
MQLTRSYRKVRLRPSLTPMIDVVFLLLVFFMLAAQYSREATIAVRATPHTISDAPYVGPPRLVDVTAEGVLLNGVNMPLAEITAQLPTLMETPTDTILVRASGEVSVQMLVDLLDHLTAAGLPNTALVEAQE